VSVALAEFQLSLFISFISGAAGRRRPTLIRKESVWVWECVGKESLGTGKESEFDPYGVRADSVPVDDAEEAAASAPNRLLCRLLFISGRLSRLDPKTGVV